MRLGDVFAARLADGVLGPADGGFLIAQWTDPGGSPEPIAPLRVHREDDEAWYVLEGMPGFRVGDHEFEAPAGAPVFGPHGVPHTFWNPRAAPARYLLVMAPQTLRLIETLHGLPDGDPETLRAHYRKYGCEILG